MIDCRAPPPGKRRPRPGAAPPPPAASPRAVTESPAGKKKASPRPAPPAVPREKVVLVFDRGNGDKPKKFKIYNDDHFDKVFGHYRKMNGGAWAFTFKGTSLDGSATPATYGVSGTATIDVAPA